MVQLSVRCDGIMSHFINRILNDCPGTIFSYGFCLNANGVSVVFESDNPEIKQRIEFWGQQWHEYNQHPATFKSIEEYEIARSKK